MMVPRTQRANRRYPECLVSVLPFTCLFTTGAAILLNPIFRQITNCHATHYLYRGGIYGEGT